MMWRSKSALRVAAALGLAVGAAASGLGGCAAHDEPARFGVATGDYDRAFAATREVLREVNFEIDRVDATRGVITTKARPDAGFFTPWTGYQLDASSAFEGSLNQQRRRVRVTFVPTVDEAAYLSGSGDQDRVGSQLDEVASRGPWTAYVDVGVTRVQTSGLRPPPRAVLMSTATIDPIAQAQGVPTIYDAPVSQDTAMAAALTRRIRKRMGMNPDVAPEAAPVASSPASGATAVDQASVPDTTLRPEPGTPASPPESELIPVPPRK